ncbi:hypothetical protein ABIB45_001908 [Arthrobacter sp. UYCo732]
MVVGGAWAAVELIPGVSNVGRERRASKSRRLRGLPRPRFALTDDMARNWFEANPSAILIPRGNFPDSTRPFPGEGNHRD